METVTPPSRLLLACVEDGSLHLDVQFEAFGNETDEEALERFYRESGLKAYEPVKGMPPDDAVPRHQSATSR